MNIKVTHRGFSLYEFRDGYGAECSLQESSAARVELDDGTVADSFIWLGIDKDNDGIPPGKETKTYDGRIVKLGARMHLTQTTVRELLPLLEHFAKYGDLPFSE